MYPLVRELAADGIPVTVTCRVLKIARQPYYRWLQSPVTAAELVEAYRANALFDAHRDDPEFGYRFLVDQAREAGELMADRTAWRICSDLGWWSAFGKPKRGKAKKPGPPVHDDLCTVVDEKGRVRHVFEADASNELWLTDITEHHTGEGKLYVCAIKDVYSNRIVGYSISDRMKSRLAVAALNNAVARRGDVAGCIVHSDRGSQAVFNRSSQHRRIGVSDERVGQAEAGPGVSGSDRVAGAADGGVASGSGAVLGGDRGGEEDARGRRSGGCFGAGRAPMVPRRWWSEPTITSHRVRSISVAVGARGYRAVARARRWRA
ncbi:Mobile element protein [Leucobacter sp. 7(1)]|nr:Mobile element protein [Leucobacter sp. 7(1)]